METINQKELKQLFPQFEPELIQELELHGMVKIFAPGEQIMRTGQYIKSTVIILDGLVKLYKEDEEGNEFFMYYLQEGNACALSMVCAAKNETSMIMAKTLTSTTVLLVPTQLMDQWMVHYKTWYYFVLETYRARFEELLETIDQIAFRALDERLEFYLKKNKEATGSDMLSISHQEIANELNSSREVISRLLKKMEQQGKVALGRNQVEILNLGV
jgi:CRP/FNR family transcriptional regulator, anaerobic regulatory protein